MCGPQVLPMLMEHEAMSTENHNQHNRQSSIARSTDRTAKGMQRALCPSTEPDATGDAHARSGSTRSPRSAQGQPFPRHLNHQEQRAQFLRNAERRKESQTRIGCRSPVQTRIRRTAAVSNVIPWPRPCICPTPFKAMEPWNRSAITCIGSADQPDAPL